MSSKSKDAEVEATTTEAPVEGLSDIGRVIVPEGATIGLVATRDADGNQVMVPANEPGHPDITTSPLT